MYKGTSKRIITDWEDLEFLEIDEPNFLEEMEEIMQQDQNYGIIRRNEEWLKNNRAYT